MNLRKLTTIFVGSTMLVGISITSASAVPSSLPASRPLFGTTVLSYIPFCWRYSTEGYYTTCCLGEQNVYVCSDWKVGGISADMLRRPPSPMWESTPPPEQKGARP